MSADLNLIHAGLPWSSPQKIAIHSTQYINNSVINRGLLSLLNNDYYLEIKTQAINNFIEKNIAGHIYDEDLHVSWSRIKNLFSTVNAASKDCIYFIPLYWNNVKLQHSIVENIINMIPKNLNGHTIVLCLCTAYSVDYNYTGEKLGMGKDVVDLEYYSILINGFIGGDLVLYSTRDIQILQNYTSITQLEAKQQNAVDIFNKIQEALDEDTHGFDTADGIILRGNGLNKDYSLLAIKNCQASIYVVNLQIENTLKWNNLNTELAKIKQLPSKDNLLNFYTLTQMENLKLQYKELYINKDFLYRNSDYGLNFVNGSNDYIIQENGGKKHLQLNTKNYLDSAMSPQYFSFDKADSQMLVSQQLRAYIYNWNGNTPHFTIAFWGNCSNQLTNYSNSPIFSDYINTINGDSGLFVYINKLYKSSSNYQDVAQYNSNFQKYYNNIIDNWGLYVLEFVHATDNIPDNVVVSTFNETPINSGNMRINLTFYRPNMSPNVLIPNSDTEVNYNEISSSSDVEKSAYLNKIGYQFKAPTRSDFYGIKNSIKLFANKRIYSNTTSLKNWDYFSGNLRNIFLFNKILTRTEINSLLTLGYDNTSYHWLSESQNKIISGMSSEKVSIGAVCSINNENLNFIKTHIIANG